jgi:hypothetical protein
MMIMPLGLGLSDVQAEHARGALQDLERDVVAAEAATLGEELGEQAPGGGLGAQPLVLDNVDEDGGGDELAGEGAGDGPRGRAGHRAPP